MTLLSVVEGIIYVIQYDIAFLIHSVGGIVSGATCVVAVEGITGHIESLLTWGQCIILGLSRSIKHFRQGEVVGAIVGDVQFTVAIDEGKVAVAINATHTISTNGNEVACIAVDD